MTNREIVTTHIDGRRDLQPNSPRIPIRYRGRGHATTSILYYTCTGVQRVHITEYHWKSTRTWREYCTLHRLRLGPGPAARSVVVSIPNFSSWSQLPRGVMCIGWSCERNRKELGVGGSDPCNPLLDLVACTAVPSRLGLKARDHTFTARADRRVDQIGCDTSSRRHPTPLNCFASKLR